MKGRFKMIIKTIETMFTQEGPNLHYFTEYEYEYETNKYSYDEPMTEFKKLISDFRKNGLSFSQDTVSDIELYLDNNLVAILQPCYTIESESFNHWNDCYMAYDTDNSLMINDVTITKRLNIIDRKKALEILASNYIETFSE